MASAAPARATPALFATAGAASAVRGATARETGEFVMEGSMQILSRARRMGRRCRTGRACRVPRPTVAIPRGCGWRPSAATPHVRPPARSLAGRRALHCARALPRRGSRPRADRARPRGRRHPDRSRAPGSRPPRRRGDARRHRGHRARVRGRPDRGRAAAQHGRQRGPCRAPRARLRGAARARARRAGGPLRRAALDLRGRDALARSGLLCERSPVTRGRGGGSGDPAGLARPERRMKRALVMVVLLALLVAAAAAGVVWRQVTLFRDTPYGALDEKVVVVPAGASARAVVRALAQAGALSDEHDAWRYVRWVKRDRRPLRAGEYAFSGPLRPDEVLERVYRGEVRLHRFTVPEGLRADEIAAIIARSGLAAEADFLSAAHDPALARSLGLPYPGLEGFLFPDTYAFARGVSARAIAEEMVERFKEEYAKANELRRPAVVFTMGEATTFASIVEKETGRPEERPRIACVFHNRLRLRMRLQTDPTVMYATMLRTGRWSKNISRADLPEERPRIACVFHNRLRLRMRLQTDPTVMYATMLRTGRWSKNISRADLLAPHPYNTYTSGGLPPGPIANAGSAALRATLAPAECSDLYFVSRNDGTHIFCPDLQCHNAAVRQWQIEFFRRVR